MNIEIRFPIFTSSLDLNNRINLNIQYYRGNLHCGAGVN